ncbi:MAG: leucine-rich repeat protein [Bacteroidales bacterium]|nr:leucine-rich repeat protein [Bacteroidales bacterium]
MRRLTVLLLCVFSALAVRGQAYDFYQTINPGDTLYYKITSTSPREVKVVNPTGNTGNRTWEGHAQPRNNIAIPATVSHGGLSYNVTAIGSYAFGNCYSFYSVTIPPGVTHIGKGAFYNCMSLISVTLANSVAVIDTQSFSNCSGLTTLTLPSALQRVCYSAFSSCSGLRGTLIIPNQVATIEAFAFGNCNAVTMLVVGSGVRTIGPRAFAMCFRLGFIDMLPTVPPQIDSTTFSYHTTGVSPVNRSTPVHVPCGSLPAYLTAPHWNYFTNIYQDPSCPQITRYDTAVCEGHFPVAWRGHSFAAAGSCVDTLPSHGGSDSLVILTVKAKDTSVNRVQASTCNSISWHGQEYRQSGVYRYTMRGGNHLRCDSTDILDLTIRHSSNGDTVVVACDSFVWHGRTYKSSTTPPVGASRGKFSVGSSLQVTFATGNLQYRASSGEWRIAPEQYEVTTYNNRNIGPSYSGWIDLFGWGTSGWNNGNTYYRPYDYASNSNAATGYGYGPVDGSSYQADLRGRFADADWCWHNAIATAGGEAGVWRTLTAAEWRYVTSGRPGAATLRGRVVISNQGQEVVKGLLLLPDDWQLPAGATFSSTMQNQYSLAEWHTMENAGAVLLPCTGYRNSLQYFPTPAGNYWSSSHESTDRAHYLMFNANSTTTYTNPADRNMGHAVRPAHDLPTYTFSAGNAQGCDSTVTLRLTIHHPTYGDSNAVVCDSFSWHRNSLRSSGTYRSDSLPAPFVLRGLHGCDSAVRLHLSVNHSTGAQVYDTIVLSQLPWNYHTYSLAAVVFPPGSRQWDTVVHIATRNQWGCDSLIEYHLAVRRDVTDTIDSTLCENALPLQWNGRTFSLSMCNQQGSTCVITSSIRFSGGGSHGEDSLLVMRLTVLRNSHSSYYDTIVENQLPHRFGSLVVRQYGIDTTITLRGSNGCDSLLSYHLYVHRNVCDTLDSAVCQEMLPLRWNGILFDTTGLSLHTGNVWTVQQSVALRAHTGADSLLTLRLFVHLNSYAVLHDTIVQNRLPHTALGCLFTGFSADTLITLRDMAGCDSLVHYLLYVHRNTSGRADSVVCEGDLPLQWNTRLFDTTGIYRISGVWNMQQSDTLLASTGADSVVLMRLHVLRNSRSDYYDTTVQNALPRTFGGRSFHGSVADTLFVLSNAMGCDSLLHYHLYVHRNTCDTLDSAACYNNLPLTWGGISFMPPASGSGLLVLNDTLHSQGSADSIIVRRLLVLPVYHTHLYDTICSDSTLLFLDTSYSLPGSHSHSLLSLAGCDSTVTLHLAVNPVTHSSYHDTVTENNLPHTFLGTTFSAFRADTTLHTVNTRGCDSAVHYTLYVHRNIYDTADSTVCQGLLPLQWNSRLFDTTGIGAQNGAFVAVQNDTLRAHTGADSILTMRLHILRNSGSLHCDTAVENALPLTFMGASIGRHCTDTTFHIPNAAGCDSAVHYRLHIYYNIVRTVDTSVCPSALPFAWNGVTFHSDSTASLLMPAAGAHGQDSTLILRLHLLQNSSSHIYDTIVQNALPRRYRDSLFTGPVSNRQFLAVNAAGCDSLISYSLYVFWNQQRYLDTSVCEGSMPLRWGRWTWSLTSGSWQTPSSRWELAAGHRADTLRTVAGADSIVLYTLHVLRNSSAYRADTIVRRQLPHQAVGCLFGRAVSDTLVVLSNAVGCDSLIHYSLYVWPDRQRRIDTAVCEGLLPLLWHRHRLSGEGCVDDTLARVGPHGEDSITTLCLRMKHNSRSQVVEHILQNDLPHTYLGHSFADTASHVPFVIANAAGCDSLIDYTLAVCRNSAAAADSDVCLAHLPLLWNGVAFTRDSTLAVTLTNHCGADSTLHMTVYVRDSSSSHLSDTIVENQLPWTFNGRRFTGGMPSTTILLRNRWGCDSLIHYSLYVHGNINIRLDTAVCQETLPIIWDGHTLSAAGTSRFTYPAVSGADSIRHYSLTVYPSYEFHDTVLACDTFVWCGSPFTRSGLYHSSAYLPLSTIHGCDSLRHLHLTLGHSNSGSATVTACASYLWLGNTLSHSGTYLSSSFIPLLNKEGCDSLATLHLTLFPQDTSLSRDTFCQSTPYIYYDTVITSPGIYRHLLSNRYGCDSLCILHLHMLTPPTVNIQVERLCHLQSYLLGTDTLLRYTHWSSSPADTTLTPAVNLSQVIVSPRTPTAYSLIADHYAPPRCPGSASVTLSPLQPVKAKMDYSPTCLTPDRLTLSAIDRSQHTIGRRWYVNDQDQGNSVNLSYNAAPLDTIIRLALEVYNDQCHDTALALVPVMLGTVYVPNSFTPDEPANNRFRVFCSDIKDYHIAIYSRNGLAIYQSSNPDDEWDGSYKGKPCPQGAYVYVITYRHKLSTDALLHQKGTILLLR